MNRSNALFVLCAAAVVTLAYSVDLAGLAIKHVILFSFIGCMLGWVNEAFKVAEIFTPCSTRNRRFVCAVAFTSLIFVLAPPQPLWKLLILPFDMAIAFCALEITVSMIADRKVVLGHAERLAQRIGLLSSGAVVALKRCVRG